MISPFYIKQVDALNAILGVPVMRRVPEQVIMRVRRRGNLKKLIKRSSSYDVINALN